VSDADPTDAVHQAIDIGSTWRLGPGDRLRDWTLGALIGQGGSSVVFEATRVDGDFSQQAALKLLRTVLADEGFHARFDRERRILLGLRHPHVVRLLDGGRSSDGVPWYAMERIDGVPLTAWCAERDVTQRLRVLVAVARAVDYAHQRLVVHCDLKPDNVLVDADGAPHVLDFGIARLIDEDERTGTLRMATPRWASPEQLEGGAVTTATDVHALGLLLWSSLTGVAPREGLTGKALWKATGEPLPAPSNRFPAARGDLDAIVLRATAPEADDRYRSAGELADDVERHLRGEAVLAREGVVWYRASRWARRNKGVVAGILMGAMLLVAWAATTSVQSQQIRAERDRAEATLDLLVGMLEAADPAFARGEELTVREVLDVGLRELEVDGEDPSIAGEVRLAAGRVQAAVGAAHEARGSLRRAHRDLVEAYGVSDPLTLRAEMHLIHARFDLDEDRAGAVRRIEEVAVALEASGSDGDAARARLHLADMHVEMLHTEAAVAESMRARAAFLALGEPREAARALAIRGYAEVLAGDVDQGTAHMREALDETIAALGTRVHPDVADILHELALVTRVDMELFEQSVALRRELYGEGWNLAAALSNHGLALESIDVERSIATLRASSTMGADARGAGHPDVLSIRYNLGAVLMDTGQRGEALEVLQAVAAEPRLPDRLRGKLGQRIEALQAALSSGE